VSIPQGIITALNLPFPIIKNSLIEEFNYQYKLTKQKKSRWLKRVKRNQIGEKSRILNFTIDANIDLLIQVGIQFISCSI